MTVIKVLITMDFKHLTQQLKSPVYLSLIALLAPHHVSHFHPSLIKTQLDSTDLIFIVELD